MYINSSKKNVRHFLARLYIKKTEKENFDYKNKVLMKQDMC